MGWLSAAGSLVAGNAVASGIVSGVNAVAGAVGGAKEFFRNGYQDIATKAVGAINEYSGDALKHDFAEMNAKRKTEAMDIGNKVATQETPKMAKAPDEAARVAELPGQDYDGSNARAERSRHFAKFYQNN